MLLNSVNAGKRRLVSSSPEMAATVNFRSNLTLEGGTVLENDDFFFSIQSFFSFSPDANVYSSLPPFM